MSSEDTLFDLLVKKGQTMSAAESCTGGLIGYKMTERPGSSKIFLGSAVTYSNESKENVLGVDHDTLMEFGAVSSETASEMAYSARELYHSDYSVAVTGIAGPDGATDIKPVGLVYIAVTDGKMTIIIENHFTGDRAAIRKATAEEAINMLLELVER